VLYQYMHCMSCVGVHWISLSHLHSCCVTCYVSRYEQWPPMSPPHFEGEPNLQVYNVVPDKRMILGKTIASGGWAIGTMLGAWHSPHT
jgi:hypothetical protein